MQLSSPAAFLLWMAAWLMASILIAGFAVMKAAPADVETELRTLSKWIFGITSVAILVPPQISMKVFHFVAEPMALVGYCWIMGLHIPAQNEIVKSGPTVTIL